MRNLWKMGVLVFAALVGGCASQPIPFNHATAPQLHTIAVANFEEPWRYVIGNTGAVEVTDFDDAMKGQGLHIGRELQTAAEAALKGEGYEIVATSLKPKETGPLLGMTVFDHTEIAAVPADAVLHISWQGVMYSNGNFRFASFTPVVVALVEMIDTKTQQILYLQMYCYVTSGLLPYEAVRLVADERFRFDSQDAIMQNPVRAAEGLRASIPMMARRLALDLAK
jgi:hypothetical protein